MYCFFSKTGILIFFFIVLKNFVKLSYFVLYIRNHLTQFQPYYSWYLRYHCFAWSLLHVLLPYQRDACIKHNVMIIAMNVDFDAITTSYNICGFNIKAKIIFKNCSPSFRILHDVFRMCDSTFSATGWKP